MRATDVVEVLDALDERDIDTWLDGGWAVDALLGEQTREHADLDLIVARDEMDAVIAALGGLGFAVVPGGRDVNLVCRDARGREVDLHAVVFDEGGAGRYPMENGDTWIFPAEGFTGRGMIAGRAVACLSGDVQMLCHAHGYEPGETDFRDMDLLRRRLGVRPLPPYDRPAANEGDR